MNKHDSERIAGSLAHGGFRLVATQETADVIIVNTCAVRERAEERLIGYVNSLSRLKRRKPTIIAVGGCVAQAYKDDLAQRLPLVDIVFGPFDIPNLPALIETVFADEGGGSPVISCGDVFSGVTTADLPVMRERSFHAWIAVSAGCDNHCTYCIVPSVRGPERSRDINDILDEAERAIASGVREITLLGQNVTSWGRDLYGEPRFAEVLREVANAASGTSRVRFTTSHPRDLSDEVITVMAESPSVCEHLHLPVQSGSDRVLEAMGREYRRGEYLDTVWKARKIVPGVSVTTDIMVGFPTETEDDFSDTLALVEEALFDTAYTFIYSPRPRTPAAAMATLDGDVVAHRFSRLVELTDALAERSNQADIGRIHEVLLERPAKRGDGVVGHSRTGKTVIVDTGHGSIGESCAVEIISAHPHHLRGRPVAPAERGVGIGG